MTCRGTYDGWCIKRGATFRRQLSVDIPGAIVATAAAVQFRPTVQASPVLSFQTSNGTLTMTTTAITTPFVGTRITVAFVASPAQTSALTDALLLWELAIVTTTDTIIPVGGTARVELAVVQVI